MVPALKRFGPFATTHGNEWITVQGLRFARGLTLALFAGAVLGPTGCRKDPAAGPGGAGPPPTQVVVIEARSIPVSETLSLVGSIAPNESVEIRAETDGIVQEINFNEGERVEKGHLLIRLDESKFAAALAEADAALKLSQSNFERAKQLSIDKLISQQEFDQTASIFAVNQASVDLKRRQLQDTRILAPFAGIVGARLISPGQVINRTTPLTWLVDLDPVKVEVDVPERYLSQVFLGQTIQFVVAAFPTERFSGEVYFIAPQLTSSTRTALIKARIPNPAAKLKGGMYANLDLTLQLRESAIVVPEPALMHNGDVITVFVVDETGIAQVRPIQVGIRLAGKAEVLTGLKEGEKVVVEGIQKVRPGGAVKQGSPEAAAPYRNSPAPKKGG